MADLTLAREAAAIAIVAATHVFAARIEAIAGARLRQLLSFAGGVAVGYVFVSLLPKMGYYTSQFLDSHPDGAGLGQLRLYLFGLGGLLVYFAADRYRAKVDGGGAVVLHGICFAAYSALIGYLIAHSEDVRTGHVPHVAVGIAMAAHLFAVDHQLRSWHRAAFDRTLRYVFAIAVIAGWCLGLWGPLGKDAIAIWSSFLAGGILVNVFSEEFPSGGRGDAPAFLAGVIFAVGIALYFFSATSVLH